MKELLKKDVILQKITLLFTGAMMIILPIFLKMAIENQQQALILPSAVGMTMSLLGLMVLNNVVDEDWKNPKALSYLVSIGYRRRDIILEKFLFALLWFITLEAIYGALTLFVPGIPKLHGEMILFFLTNYLFLVGPYLMLTIIFGSSVGRIFFTMIILLISLGPQIIKIYLKKNDITLDLEKIVSSISVVTIAGISIVIFILFYFLSLYFFMKREL